MFRLHCIRSLFLYWNMKYILIPQSYLCLKTNTSYMHLYEFFVIS